MKVTKSDIIRALLNESFMRSTGATSLKDIADKVGLKKASLYNHFESRDDLVKQTFESCAEYIQAITFTPRDIDSVAKKYPPEVVLKGIVNRYFKMHEKAPLFQIYTFIESQKYFCTEACDIIKNENKKLTDQTKLVLKSLASFDKIKLPEDKIDGSVSWFCAGIKEMLDEYLMERKQVVMNNPAAGEGELFSLPSNEGSLDRIDSFIDYFVATIKSPSKS